MFGRWVTLLLFKFEIQINSNEYTHYAEISAQKKKNTLVSDLWLVYDTCEH